MPTVLLPLHYLPSITWFWYYLHYNCVEIEHCENFVKATGRNRCYISGPNGKLTLSIPLQGGRDHHRLYKDTRISYQQNWQVSHWRSMVAAYNSTPFFEYYAPKLQPLYNKQYEFLFDYNLQLFEALKAMLKIETPYTFTTEYKAENSDVTDCRMLAEKNNPRYYQIFEERNGFIAGLSVVDLLFHAGPEAKAYLLKWNS